MAKTLKYNYELKDSSESMTLLSITFTWQHKRNKVSLGIKVPPPDWNKGTHRVVITSEQSQATQREMRRVNRFLNKFEEAIAQIKVDWVDEGFTLHGNINKMAELVKHELAILQNKETRDEEARTITPIEFF